VGRRECSRETELEIKKKELSYEEKKTDEMRDEEEREKLDRLARVGTQPDIRGERLSLISKPPIWD
jgi:hypothetical protein